MTDTSNYLHIAVLVVFIALPSSLFYFMLLCIFYLFIFFKFLFSFLLSRLPLIFVVFCNLLVLLVNCNQQTTWEWHTIKFKSRLFNIYTLLFSVAVIANCKSYLAQYALKWYGMALYTVRYDTWRRTIIRRAVWRSGPKKIM